MRRSSLSISNSANSARSTRRIFDGWNRATWRASSEPIEPPGAGHHDALARQELSELRLVEVHGLAAQQVLDLDVADARDVDLALQHVVQARG